MLMEHNEVINTTDQDYDECAQEATTLEETKNKYAYVKVLESITNNFYKTDENDIISIELSKEKSQNYYDKQRIVLAEGLIDAFGDLNLPRFLIYYHELGHHLFSQGLFKLLKTWETFGASTQNPLTWDDKYHHLINWIEDFHVEDKLIQNYPYFTDVLTCIKKLPPEYDINRIEYAFNFWYINQAPTPALSYTDQIAFKAYVNKLQALRSNHKVRFGYGILTTLSIKQSTETKYALLIIEFYNWCVSKGIFPKDKPLPSLSNPNAHLDNGQGSNSQSNQSGGQDNQSNNNPQPSDDPQPSKGGTSSDHSKTVGTTEKYTEAYHIKSPTTVFKEELITENKLIQKELMDMSQRIQSEATTLDGLFSARDKDSSLIQSKVNVPNFFNPNRLVDQVLFKEKLHVYMNVAIYRDVSGSTTGSTHTLMHQVCEQLYKDIPVNITYYLYASGDVSIVEVPYVQWQNSYETPKEYKDNKLVQQLGAGTNSDAIADVITQQFSEKWLNVIVTDGDLFSLLNRTNIMNLLKNVFVIVVDANNDNLEVPKGLLGTTVSSSNDLNKINPILSTINLDK